MNRIYRIVWNRSAQSWTVTSEIARGRGKSRTKKLAAAFTAGALCGITGAQVGAPTGGCGTITSGTFNNINCSNAGAASLTILPPPGTPVTVTVPNTNNAVHGILVTVTGNSASGSANVNGTDVTNNNVPPGGADAAAIGIEVLISSGSNNATGNGTLTLTGTNNITTAKGGGTLVNVFGSGNGTTDISGIFNVTSNFTNADSHDGVETTVRGGIATLNMQSTGTVSVKSGNGILIDSLTAGGILRGTIGSGVIIVLDNTVAGSGATLFRNAGIATSTLGVGTTDLTTAASVQTMGNNADGIHATGRLGYVNVKNSGPIRTAGTTSHGIAADTSTASAQASGTLSVDNSGTITTQGGTSLTDASNGILATTSTTAAGASGAVMVTNSGSISTSGALADAIQAKTTRSATAGPAGDVTVGNSGTVRAMGRDANAILALSGTGAVQVTNSSPGQVHGAGGASGAGVVMGGSSQSLANSGSIDALSERAIVADLSGVPSTVLITNSAGGQITGGITVPSSPATINNAGTWNLRNFADLDGDGTRETLSVAKGDFGSSAGNVINNTGTIALYTHDGTATTLNSAGQYLPLGNPNNAMALHSPTQGQILGVPTFNNSGIIDLTTNPSAGDVLVISGGRVPGTDGGGVFVTNGGTLRLNAVLNQGGGSNSIADVLVVDSVRVGTAPTGISVVNVGGAGAPQTAGNGIALIEVLNKAASPGGAFTLTTAAVAGPYEYLLYRGGNAINSGDPADGNWYLRSEVVILPPPPPPPPAPPPGPPTPPPPGPPPPVPPPPPNPDVIPPPVRPIVRPLYRPEVGAYLSNQRQAAGMFLHSLHDRLGEPQWVEGQTFDTQDDKRRSGWIRIANRNTDAVSRDGIFEADANSTLIQGGGDIARWGVGGDTGRLHLGAMLGYGESTGDAFAQFNVRAAHTKVEGWSAGLYGTWYQNDADRLGWYADVWGTYGWFKNTVRGDLLPDVDYDATAYVLSGETGYAARIASSDWVVEPQAQLIYVKYDEDAIVEPNGTTINRSDGSGWISRLGVRTYRTWVREDGRKLQPYLTLNWWHDNQDNSESFNNVALQNMYPSNRYEVKLGLNADLARGWSAWGNLGYQWGNQGYQATTARLGAKYTW